MASTEGSSRRPGSAQTLGRPIRRVAVIGAGTMGHGIAQLSAQVGCEVVLQDVEDRFLDSGMQKIRWSLGKLVEKNKVTQSQADQIIHRIKTTTDLKLAVSQSDLVVEAAPEVMQVKKGIFAVVDGHAPD